MERKPRPGPDITSPCCIVSGGFLYLNQPYGDSITLRLEDVVQIRDGYLMYREPASGSDGWNIQQLYFSDTLLADAANRALLFGGVQYPINQEYD